MSEQKLVRLVTPPQVDLFSIANKITGNKLYLLTTICNKDCVLFELLNLIKNPMEVMERINSSNSNPLLCAFADIISKDYMIEIENNRYNIETVDRIPISLSLNDEDTFLNDNPAIKFIGKLFPRNIINDLNIILSENINIFIEEEYIYIIHPAFPAFLKHRDGKIFTLDGNFYDISDKKEYILVNKKITKTQNKSRGINTPREIGLVTNFEYKNIKFHQITFRKIGILEIVKCLSLLILPIMNISNLVEKPKTLLDRIRKTKNT